MSTLFVDTINEKTTNNGVIIPGHSIQTVTGIKSDVQTGNNTSYADISSLTATITPSSTSSKIMLFVDVHCGGTTGTIYYFRCVRNGSTFFTNSDNAGAEDGSMWSYYSDTSNFSGPHYQGHRQFFNYLDSPATTSALTYKIQARVYGGTTYYWRCNQGDSTSDSSRITTVSSITLMEIAQ